MEHLLVFKDRGEKGLGKLTVRRVYQSNNKAAKLRGPEIFLFLFPMKQRVRNASNDYQAAGRCRWGGVRGFGREDGFGKGLWFTLGGGGGCFLEKASTYAASPFIVLFYLVAFVFTYGKKTSE